MEFLRSLKGRGLDGVKLVISDAHTGLKAAIARVFDATWQRCRVPWMRNALAHVPRGRHTVVAAAIRQAFSQPDQDGAAQALAPRRRSPATPLAESEQDVLAYIGFPPQHRTKLHSTNPIERLNKEVKRCADVVGVRPRPRTDGGRASLPNEASITRLIGAILSEQNDEWQTQHRYMQVEAFAQIDAVSTDPLLSIETEAA